MWIWTRMENQCKTFNYQLIRSKIQLIQLEIFHEKQFAVDPIIYCKTTILIDLCNIDKEQYQGISWNYAENIRNYAEIISNIAKLYQIWAHVIEKLLIISEKLFFVNFLHYLPQFSRAISFCCSKTSMFMLGEEKPKPKLVNWCCFHSKKTRTLVSVISAVNVAVSLTQILYTMPSILNDVLKTIPITCSTVAWFIQYQLSVNWLGAKLTVIKIQFLSLHSLTVHA